MDNAQHEDRPLGPVEFLNRAVAVILAALAAGGIYVGTVALFSLERVAS